MADIEIVRDETGKALEVRVRIDAEGRIAIAPADKPESNPDIPDDVLLQIKAEVA